MSSKPRPEIDLSDQLAALDGLTAPQLRRKYGEVFNETTNSHNKKFLRRRIAWRLQELAFGGLSWRAQARAEELAADTSLRHLPPRIASSDAGTTIETSLPAEKPKTADKLMPGMILSRLYKGKTYEVEVLDSGFLYSGMRYQTLSAIAKEITGGHCSGNLFFKLRKQKRNDTGDQK